jgi:transcriptional regulator with XRE-family HTH domain
MPRTKSSNSIDEHVGSRIRMRRKMLTMSQTKLADALGISFQQVGQYEKGTYRIGASRLHHIAQILQVPATFFFEDTPDLPGATAKSAPPASPKPVMDFMTTSEGLALAKAFMRVRNKQMRRRIIDLVEEIVG